MHQPIHTVGNEIVVADNKSNVRLHGGDTERHHNEQTSVAVVTIVSTIIAVATICAVLSIFSICSVIVVVCAYSIFSMRFA